MVSLTYRKFVAGCYSPAMTPAQLKVIEAARKHVDHECESGYANLVKALDALDAETAGPVEMDIRWDQVVESDQIWSTATKNWYEVISSGPTKDPDRVRIQAKGPGSFTRLAAGMVRVRRGPTGQAVDMWNVVWSMQTIPTIRESEEAS